VFYLHLQDPSDIGGGDFFAAKAEKLRHLVWGPAVAVSWGSLGQRFFIHVRWNLTADTPAAGSIDLDWHQTYVVLWLSMGILIPTGIHEKPFKQIQATSVFAQNFVSPWHCMLHEIKRRPLRKSSESQLLRGCCF